MVEWSLTYFIQKIRSNIRAEREFVKRQVDIYGIDSVGLFYRQMFALVWSGHECIYTGTYRR